MSSKRGPFYVVASNAFGDDFMQNRITYTVNETRGPVRELTLSENLDPEAVQAAIAALVAEPPAND